MKKRNVVIIFSAILAVALLFGGCAASPKNNSYLDGADYYNKDDSYTYSTESPRSSDKDLELEEEMSPDVPKESPAEAVREIAAKRKIVMTASYTVETKGYDDSYKALLELTEKYGGYVSASDYRGISLDSYGSRSRYCTVTVRVPAENYRVFTGSLADIGNISYSYESTNDVTTQYYDLQARIESLQVQEKRLLELLEKAETVEDILQIEAQLSDVRYQIESFQTNFKVLSDSVSYSTVTVELKEVIEYSKEPVKELTFGEKIVRRLSDGWDAFVKFCQGFVLVVLVCLPFLVLLGIIAVVVVLICINARKRRERRRAAMMQEAQAAQAQRAETGEQPADEQK